MTQGLISGLLRARLGDRGIAPGYYLLWLLVTLPLLCLLPATLLLHMPLWYLPAAQLVQFYVLSVAYGLYFLFLLHVAGHLRSPGILRSLMLGCLWFALCCGFLLLVPELTWSRLLMLVGALLGIGMVLIPFFLPVRLLTLLTGLLALLLAALLGWQWSWPAPLEERQRGVFSSVHDVRLRIHPSLVPSPASDGGALAPAGDDFLLVTGDAVFYRLSWGVDRASISAQPMALPELLPGRDAFYAEPGLQRYRFRVTDLLLRETGQGYEVFVAHQLWNAQERCFSMAVSRLLLSVTLVPLANAAWSRVYETRPCLPLGSLDLVETGGRIAFHPSGAILLTVGDHGMDGRKTRPIAQDMQADYGKVLLLDMHGGAQLFSSGHRNPQGLLVSRDGSIWSTEHGPRGGDELNLLRQGNNYGWPKATYGTDYHTLYWPVSQGTLDHGKYTEPVFAFVPSIAVANLIEIGDKQFPRWRGDLLLGTLREQNLYRMRLREGRVIFAEAIAVGREIRDHVEAPDGRILIWSDDGTIIVLSAHEDSGPGEQVYRRCRVCHEPAVDGRRAGPDLRGVVGRPVASMDFNYSAALQSLGGRWTVERLDVFLANPQAYAPGTSMGQGQVPDPVARAALIEYLRGK